MSDLRDMDDWGYIADAVSSDVGLGTMTPEMSALRATLLWPDRVPQRSHDVADLVERSIDRGEA